MEPSATMEGSSISPMEQETTDVRQSSPEELQTTNVRQSSPDHDGQASSEGVLQERKLPAEETVEDDKHTDGSTDQSRASSEMEATQKAAGELQEAEKEENELDEEIRAAEAEHEGEIEEKEAKGDSVNPNLKGETETEEDEIPEEGKIIDVEDGDLAQREVEGTVESADTILKGETEIEEEQMPEESKIIDIADDELAHMEAEEDTNQENDDSPIEEVRLTVPTVDDPSLPVLTFRTWVLGISICATLSFMNQFFSYHNNPMSVGATFAQILLQLLGKVMAATLPRRKIKVPLTNWSFSLNPGAFNMKEHALMTVFANAGTSSVYALHIITTMWTFYHRKLNLPAAFLISITTQMIGYGFAGLFRKFLVDSPYMWWPSKLVQVSLFRTLHETEKRPKGGITRLQFFLIVLVSSFAYYIVPGYLFPSISALSFVCWIWKNSVTAQQIGSGMSGLGIGSLALDWNAAAGFLGSPLAYPRFAIINILVGFFLVVYVALPVLYWSNAYEAKRFPLISSRTFDSSGKEYNVSRIINPRTFDINLGEYERYSKLYVSAFLGITYGLSFALLTSTVSHVALFHGKTIWQMLKKTAGAVGHVGDVHTKIMRKNYESVPQWWFTTILIISVGIALLVCEGFHQLQLPWWGVVLACGIAFVLTLPVGVILATTNMAPGLSIITDLVIGYLYPGKPLANTTFKTYGYISMTQAHMFLGDFKLGHYMKIPPKSMFVVQLVSILVSCIVYYGTAWWLLTSIKDICNPSSLPDGSPWTCPGDDVFYHASIIWGVVGPLRMFGRLGVYPQMNWFFLFGFLAPFPTWYLSWKFPEKKWMQYINVPIIIGASQGIPPGRAVNYVTWGAVGLFFNFYIYKRYKSWWIRYNYALSAALDAGVILMGLFLFFTLQSHDMYGPSWWGRESPADHCKLAQCPTASGVEVHGCPVIM